jgi:hypothetical protein
MSLQLFAIQGVEYSLIVVKTHSKMEMCRRTAYVEEYNFNLLFLHNDCLYHRLCSCPIQASSLLIHFLLTLEKASCYKEFCMQFCVLFHRLMCIDLEFGFEFIVISGRCPICFCCCIPIASLPLSS